jgi:hypothetical protein
VNMPQCPVVMARRNKLTDRARCIWRVSRMAFERCVQQRQVETTRNGQAIGRGDVLERRRLLVTSPVDRNTEIGKLDGFALPVPERINTFGKSQVPGHPAFGIMIAVNDKRPDSGAREPSKLADSILAGCMVLPCPVVKIA